MWMTRGAALSDVVLAPAGVLIGRGILDLLQLVPGWPGGMVGNVAGLLMAVAVVLVWPTWLARQRGEQRATGSAPDIGSLGTATVLAVPTVVAGVTMGLLQGLPLDRAVFGQLSNLPASTTGLIRVVLVLVMGVGSFLVLTLVARRAPTAFEGLDMSVTAGLRTYGLGLAGAATVLQMLYAIGTGRPAVLGLVVGAALASTVLLVDRLVTVNARAPRAAIITAPIVAAALWLFGGGLLFGGPLLPRLALATTAATLALCIGALVLASRTWSAVLLPLAASVWLVGVLPVVG